MDLESTVKGSNLLRSDSEDMLGLSLNANMDPLELEIVSSGTYFTRDAHATPIA